MFAVWLSCRGYERYAYTITGGQERKRMLEISFLQWFSYGSQTVKASLDRSLITIFYVTISFNEAMQIIFLRFRKPRKQSSATLFQHCCTVHIRRKARCVEQCQMTSFFELIICIYLLTWFLLDMTGKNRTWQKRGKVQVQSIVRL